MNKTLQAQFASQITNAVVAIEELEEGARQEDLSDLPFASLHKSLTLARAAVSRVAGDHSRYGIDAEAVATGAAFIGTRVRCIKGVLQALKSDLDSGFLPSVEELIHGELFADFLEMGDHLLSEGYKDPAAVIVGGALEAHLRQLCQKHSVPYETGGRHKKADQMNSELAQGKAYSKLDQKNVTAWLDLRSYCQK